MHPIFSTPDVFCNILDFVNLQVPNPDPFHGHHEFCHHNPTLASLVVTCKAFMEPVLDVLWKSQRSLGPLVRTLPEDCWEEEVFGTYQSKPAYEIEFTRSPLRSEWVRFDFYSHRIKELGHWRFEFADRHSTNHCAIVDVNLRRRVTFGVVACLALYRKDCWLLPNLTSLRWNKDDWPYTNLLPLFLGPNMTRLAIGYNAAPEEHSGVLESHLGPQIMSFHDICPTLTQLEIYPNQPKSVIDAAVIFALQCPTLESFMVSNPDPWSMSFIQHLSKQPFLREVRLRMDQETSYNLALLHTASLHYPFPSLRILSVMVPSLTPCVTLIQMMRTCRLTTAIFHLTDRIFVSEIAGLFAALHEHCSTATLQVVEIHRHTNRDWVLSSDDAFHLDHLEPLLCFPNMRGLAIETPLVVDMDNDDLRTMADAWPLLVSLLFMDRWGFANLPEITWAGVGYLLWKCPQLIYLSISLDTRIDDVALTTSLPSFRPNTHLRFLWVTDSVLDDVEVFAHSLFAVAPLVVGIDGWGHEDESLEISVPMANASAFLDQVESLMWELRRTQMRDKFAFLDGYVLNEAEEMNPFSLESPARRFPYGKLGRTELEQREVWT